MTETPAGGSKIVYALRSMFASEAIHTFQLNHQHVFHEDVSEVVSVKVTFVVYWKGSLASGPDATKTEFSEQSAFIGFHFAVNSCVPTFTEASQNNYDRRLP